jgi:p24 family protein delta-1
MVCLKSSRPWPRILVPQSWALLLCICVLLLQPSPTYAIKFSLQSYRYPPQKCIWNPAHSNALVIVTANVGPGEGQRVDVEIVDSSPQKNKYLSKKGINGETRLAVTTHADGEVGVCFRNYLDNCEITSVVLATLFSNMHFVLVSRPCRTIQGILTNN